MEVADGGRTARRLAGSVATVSLALMVSGLALYFCCLEALPSIGKYARASQVRICLRAQNGNLSFTVSDDGAGYDVRRTPLGSGQRNMADRLAALGGRLEVKSAPSQGTTITAHLPVPAAH